MLFASVADVRAWFCAALLLTFRFLRAEPGHQTVSEFPIEFREGLLWVDVIVQPSKEPLHFLLDSGASVSVISLNAAKRLGLTLGPKVTVLSVCTKVTGHWPVKLSARAGAVELPDQLLALDLSRLSCVCSNSVDGLIGADFFRDRVVQIDYDEGKARLLDPKPQASQTQTIPLEIRRCGLRVPVNINDGRRQWVRLDTGCATALQWVTTRISADKCTSKLAVGLAETAVPQTVPQVSFGGQSIAGVATGLHRKPIFPGEAGLLGNGLLSRFGVVTIDCKSGCVILGSPSE